MSDWLAEWEREASKMLGEWHSGQGQCQAMRVLALVKVARAAEGAVKLKGGWPELEILERALASARGDTPKADAPKPVEAEPRTCENCGQSGRCLGYQCGAYKGTGFYCWTPLPAPSTAPAEPTEAQVEEMARWLVVHGLGSRSPDRCLEECRVVARAVIAKYGGIPGGAKGGTR